ncbi:rhomboid protein [Anaeramoeba ignava]|uniref:Rhomboid protein n=1 Tax=Anaeramoeba ignava TaxID=1746090 RepID=A0A9Q0RF05_ANAIG|nr:rhomboid protein [Anaeramoeba ignava]
MELGPKGFYNAPFTKTLFVLIIFFSAMITILNINPNDLSINFESVLKKFELYRIFSSQIFFLTPSETLFGVLLLYYFRSFERQMGSSKFILFCFLSFIQSLILQLAYLVIHPRLFIPPGPYGIIFSCFVLFYSQIPSTQEFFRFSRFRLTNKIFFYIIGIQILIILSQRSLIPFFSGIIPGLIYVSAQKIRNINIPVSIQNLGERRILPLIQERSTTSRINTNLHQEQITGENDIQNIFHFDNNGNDNDDNDNQDRRGRRRRNQRNPNLVQRQRANLTDIINFLEQYQPQELDSREQDQTEENIQKLIEMGFEREVAQNALEQAGGNLDIALNHLLN